MLNELPPCKHALFLGDGDGRLLEQFCRVQPACQITSVDQSQRMLDLQRQRVERWSDASRIQWICQDATKYRPATDEFDLLVTAFFLDCFSIQQLKRLVPHWLQGVRAGGNYYCVDFTRPTAGCGRIRAILYLGLMHWFFRWQTGLANRQLVAWEDVLSQQPMALLDACTLDRGLIRCVCYRMGSVQATSRETTTA